MSHHPTAPGVRWVLRAKCAQIDPAEIDSLFYPSDGQPIPDETANLCGECPVREQCLATAMAAHYPEGIWGGVDMRGVFGRTARARASRT